MSERVSMPWSHSTDPGVGGMTCGNCGVRETWECVGLCSKCRLYYCSVCWENWRQSACPFCRENRGERT